MVRLLDPAKRKRPATDQALSRIAGGDDTSVANQLHESAAHTALRCAWLRAHAEYVYELDPTGQLAAQLLDFADLLELCQRRGVLA